MFEIIEIILSLEKTFLAWDLLIVIDFFRDEKDKSSLTIYKPEIPK